MASPVRQLRPATRLQPIDTVRGAVMILMALDHVRDFMHSAAFAFSPTDLTRTTAAIFFTRWVTHFCAPVFMFTAGLGAFLYARNRTRSQLARFLWTRGLWLIVLELIVVHLALSFNFDYHFLVLNVLWALGWSMVALGALIHLPVRVLTILSVATICLHNALDRVQAAQLGALGPLWNLLHQIGAIQIGGRTIVAAYPFIPWFAVMAAGYCCGPLFLLDPDRRRRILVWLGAGLSVAFVAVRALNIYGDPAPWSKTLLSFLNCQKYPPSLDFLLMTLGPALLVMGLLEGVMLRPGNPLVIFGRTPLFYFVIHLFVIHAAAVLLGVVRYGEAGWALTTMPSMGGPKFPADYGYSLGVIYAIWICVVAAMYPLCRWFAGVKRHRTDGWLSYL